jgi:hypothetical protein
MKELPTEFGALITVRNKKTGEDTVFCRIGRDPSYPWVGQDDKEHAPGEYSLEPDTISGWSYLIKHDPLDLIDHVQEESGLTLLEEDARVIIDFFSEGRKP